MDSMTIRDCYRLTLPDMPTYTMNSRAHWSKRADVMSQWRTVAGLMARQARIPRLDRAVVTLEMTPADRRRRDADGIQGALKPCLDGLVDAGVFEDDSWRFVPEVRCRIAEPDRGLSEHRWVLEIVDYTDARAA